MALILHRNRHIIQDWALHDNPRPWKCGTRNVWFVPAINLAFHGLSRHNKPHPISSVLIPPLYHLISSTFIPSHPIPCHPIQHMSHRPMTSYQPTSPMPTTHTILSLFTPYDSILYILSGCIPFWSTLIYKNVRHVQSKLSHRVTSYPIDVKTMDKTPGHLSTPRECRSLLLECIHLGE